MRRYDGMVHGFFAMAVLLEAAQEVSSMSLHACPAHPDAAVASDST